MKRYRCEHGVIIGGQKFCRPCIRDAFALRDRLRATTITHDFRLRDNLLLRWNLPVDLTSADVQRIARWLSTLVVPKPPTQEPPHA